MSGVTLFRVAPGVIWTQLIYIYIYIYQLLIKKYIYQLLMSARIVHCSLLCFAFRRYPFCILLILVCLVVDSIYYKTKFISVDINHSSCEGLLHLQPSFHACRAIDVGVSVFLLIRHLCSLPTHWSFYPQVINGVARGNLMQLSSVIYTYNIYYWNCFLCSVGESLQLG